MSALTLAEREAVRRAAVTLVQRAARKRLCLLVAHLDRLHQRDPDNARIAADLAAYKEALHETP